jgi:threonine dehydratase
MTETKPSLPVSAADIEAAAKVVAPFAVRTPLLSFPCSMSAPARKCS